MLFALPSAGELRVALAASGSRDRVGWTQSSRAGQFGSHQVQRPMSEITATP